MARLFVAIWPSDDVVSRVCELPRKSSPGVRFVPPSNWHVTLRFLGDADVDEVIDALDTVLADGFVPTEMTLGPVVELLGDHSLILDADGVDALTETVERATRHLGKPPRHRFRGHLTLARLARRAHHRTRRQVTSIPALGMPLATSCQVEQIALVESILRPDGARYEVLTTWDSDPHPRSAEAP